MSRQMECVLMLVLVHQSLGLSPSPVSTSEAPQKGAEHTKAYAVFHTNINNLSVDKHAYQDGKQVNIQETDLQRADVEDQDFHDLNKEPKVPANMTDVYDNVLHENHINFQQRSLVKKICGFRRMCSKNYSPFVYAHSPTCCQKCSCLPSCAISRNCCPDVNQHLSDNDTTSITCMPLYNILNLATGKDTEKSTIKVSTSTTDKVMGEEAITNQTVTTTEKNPEEARTRRPGKEPITDMVKEKVTNNLVQEATDSGSTGGDKIRVTLNDDITTNRLYASYLVTVACPSDYSDSEVAKKCSGTDSVYTQDFIPVVDMENKRVYKNVHCAKCYGTSMYRMFGILTDCIQLYLMDTVPEYLTELRQKTQNCTVYLQPGSIFNIQDQICRSEASGENIINACNITGRWENYDRATEELCIREDKTVLFPYREGNLTFTYKNMFCYLCNSKENSYDRNQCPTNKFIENHSADDGFQTFKTYIDLHLRLKSSPLAPLNAATTTVLDSPALKACGTNYIVDVYTKQCRQILCPLYQVPILGMCAYRNSQVTGLTLVGKLKVTLTSASIYVGNQSREEIKAVAVAIQNEINIYLQTKAYNCIHRPGEISAHTLNDYIHDLFIVYKLQNTYTCAVERLVQIFTKLDQENITLKEHYTENITVPGFSVKLTYSRPLTDNDALVLIPADSQNTHEIMLHASFYCPRVVLNETEYYKLIESGHLQPVSDMIQKNEYETHKVEICLDHYLQYWLTNSYQHTPVKGSDTEQEIQVTISKIATIISMVSLIIVIITYMLFSELRFNPGKLFMVLCINLLTAQAFYAFGLDFGIDNFWCKLLGMCIHFFWLATIFSTNSLLFLMLRSFHKPLHAENRIFIESRSNREILKYIIYCYTMPLVFVLINVASFSLNLTSEFGYGGSLCYIRSKKMQIFTFAMPVGIVMCINFIMLIHILSSLSLALKGCYNSLLVKQLYIFLKLSTMTGMYWLFGFLYDWTRITMFSYLFIVMNAGQGFFLMWSLMFNKHVLNLYKALIRKYVKKLLEKRTLTGSQQIVEPVSGLQESSTYA